MTLVADTAVSKCTYSEERLNGLGGILPMKRIDLHIHTVATRFDRKGFAFSMDILKRYIKEANLEAIAITNHNMFDEENYLSICKEAGIAVFPGIEVNVTTPGKYGHVLIVADPADVGSFSAGASQIAAQIDGGRDHLGWDEVRAALPNIGKYLVIPHYRKDKQLDDATLDAIRQASGIDALEVSTPKWWLREDGNVPEPLVIFSDSRPGEVLVDEDDPDFLIRYKYGFTYVRCDDMTVPAIKLAMRDKRNVNIFNEGNAFEILPEGIPVSRRLNVIVGKRSSGKTFSMKRIMDSLDQSDYVYIRQFQITNKAEEETFKKESAKEDELFAAQYFDPVQELLGEYFTWGESNEGEVGDYCEAIVKFAKSPENDCSNYPIFTAQGFVLDGIRNNLNNDFELIKAARLIRTSDRRDLVEEFLGIDALLAFEQAVDEAAFSEFIKLKHMSLADGLRKGIQQGLAQFSARKPLPEIAPLREYFKESFFEQSLASLVDELKKTEKLDDDVEGNFKRTRKRCAIQNATEAKSEAKGVPREVKLTGLFEKNATSLSQIRFIKQLPSEVWPIASRLLFKLESEVVNNDKEDTPLSGGQRAEYVFVHEIKKAERVDYVFIDEPESSFDNEFLIEDIAGLLHGLARRATVFLVTHNNTMGVSLHPDCILYATKDESGYKLYSGDAMSADLVASDGSKSERAEALLKTMEAGRPAYDDRKGYYGIA